MEAITRISSRSDFHAAVRAALAEAAAEGWREICLCDPDFADWPLGESGLIASLTQWARAPRRLTVLALNFDELSRRHPRFVNWRRQWAHVAQCRSLQELQAGGVPVLLHVTGVLTLRLLDPLRLQGSVSRLPSDILQAGEMIDAISQRSVEAFPATALGL